MLLTFFFSQKGEGCEGEWDKGEELDRGEAL